MHRNRQDLLQSLIQKLIKTVNYMHGSQNFSLGKMVLGRQQVMTLFFIDDNANLVSLNSLAKFLNVTPGAVTQLVDSLVEKKLLKREENKKDRRSINIRLTPAAEKKIKAFKEQYLINSGSFFSGLEDKDLSQLINLLDKVKTPAPK